MSRRDHPEQRYCWAVLGVGAQGALGAVPSASAGESLDSQLVAIDGRSAEGRCTVVEAGHSGAKAAGCDIDTPPSCDPATG